MYPENEAYHLLIGNRSGEQEDKDGYNAQFIQQLKATKQTLNHMVFVLSDNVPYVCSVLGHAMIDAEPCGVLKALIEAGCDPLKTEMVDQETYMDAENFLNSLKKTATTERMNAVKELTGNNLNKLWFKETKALFKELNNWS